MLFYPKHTNETKCDFINLCSLYLDLRKCDQNKK